MQDETEESWHYFSVGDVVSESPLIIPPDRNSWCGVIIKVHRGFYETDGWLDTNEDMAVIYWFQSAVIEQLPSSVIILVQAYSKK
jgi:hypothetical protein